MLHNLLQNIHPIFLEINWYAIRYFVLGFATGIVLLILSITFILSRSERKKAKIRMSHQIPLDDEAVNELIETKKQQLDETVKMTNNAYIEVAFDLSQELVEEIAKYYFPKSNYPIYELSIQEMLDLAQYIAKRLDGFVNARFVKMFKNYRVSSILEMLNAKKKLDNSKLMQVTRKLRIQKLYSGFRAVVNYANPIYWFRKLAIKPTTQAVTREIGKFIITVFGEETNKVYSKAIFKPEDDIQEIDNKLEALMEASDEELEQGSEE